MTAIDAADSEASFARCAAGVAIGEAFGWAAGGIIGGAAGDNPYARLGGMALEDWITTRSATRSAPRRWGVSARSS